ncbi:MAG: hypothetical protein KDC66_05875 [Phaeodactylibacter sp.]|nr:hypothetical protein [Phaeodactylibacter sp.]MCB9273108.1 hypothetical protein [Lewinellaceae bacterium]
MFSIYGIRHHGPGSARSLLRALQAQRPDAILIEAPADTEKVLEYAGHPRLVPPVAVLVYDEKDLSRASYLPFAEFSPEWQAIQYGLKESLPIIFMDLPMSMQFQLEAEKAGQLEIPLPDSEQEPPLIRDPMGYIAELAGYTDSERWWEATFEQTDNEADIFQAIISLNVALREEPGRQEPPLNRLREAHMRKALRKALKDGFKKLAVVCGAWHAPALHYLDRYPPASDNALLKGLKKSKTKATWIPWSHQRLAFQSGYRAGVVSPAWYALLFGRREEAVLWWMSRVAQLLRQEGIAASAAHAVEAARLAHTLAALRQQPVAGIEEMKEAVLAVFCEGQEAPLKTIESRLIIGEEVGEVPPDIPQIPLQQDLEARIRATRLTKAYQSASPEDKVLDLRKAGHLEASHLLHQLSLLGIPWGVLQEAPEGRLGNFSETWRLHWQPEYIIRLIEAGMWGNTVYAAASHYARKRAGETEKLSELVTIVRSALLAGITEAFASLIGRLEDAAARTRDVYHLLEALPVLADIARYGDTRQTDVQAVEALLNHIVPRIAIGLPGAVMNIEEEAAREWFPLFLQGNRAVSLLGQAAHFSYWNRALGDIAGAAFANPLLSGLCCRMLFDRSLLSAPDTAARMRQALSLNEEAEQGAWWLEGFLYGSGLLLIHTPELWPVLDEWVAEIPEARFPEVLPLLRRAFAGFTGPEREKMFALARSGVAAGETATPDVASAFGQKRAKTVLPTLRMLLGLEED